MKHVTIVGITKLLEFILIEHENDFLQWKPHYSDFNIRYYWLNDTYYNIFYNGQIAGVGGLHKLKKDNTFLMRGCYIIPNFRKKNVTIDGKGIHQHSIEYRLNLANSLNAKTLWVRCNKNSIKNYQKYGFETVLDSDKQYVPLCLKLNN